MKLYASTGQGSSRHINVSQLQKIWNKESTNNGKRTRVQDRGEGVVHLSDPEEGSSNMVHILISKIPNASVANRWGIFHVSVPNTPGTSNNNNHNREDVHAGPRPTTTMNKKNPYKWCTPLQTTAPHKNVLMKYWASWQIKMRQLKMSLSKSLGMK